MKHATTLQSRNRRGSALVLSLIFIVMFTALVSAVAAFSGANVQIAKNFRKADTTRGCAESGLEVVRYWMSQVNMSGTIADSERFTTLATTLQSKLGAVGATNILSRLTCTPTTITMANVPLNASSGECFTAVLTKIDDYNVRLDVTGIYGSANRKIQCYYSYFQRADTAFTYGLATKGPLYLSGSVEFESVIDVYSDAYVQTNETLALSVTGKSMIDGDVTIVTDNGAATQVEVGPSAGVGGAIGNAAMEHITISPGPGPEFPEMDPSSFFHYANNPISPTATVGLDGTCDNLYIPANRNPDFSGNVTLKGVVYIEAPNVVTFSGTANITAIIVTNGDPCDNSATNQIHFKSNIIGHPVTELTDPKFADISAKLGTFIMAPGFKLRFGGTFTTLCGAIAGNGIEFYGGAGGNIDGTIINYSDTQMSLSGSSDLTFTRTLGEDANGQPIIPAGFAPRIVMMYDPSTYSEPAL